MPAATFADLLELELARVADEAPAVPDANAASAASLATSPLPTFRPFARFDVAFVAKPTPYGAISASGLVPASTTGEARARLALESALITSRDFSLVDLRGAFRRLAREYHPDCHPRASDVEAAQWSGSFAAIERRYRQLAADLAARQ